MLKITKNISSTNQKLNLCSEVEFSMSETQCLGCANNLTKDNSQKLTFYSNNNCSNLVINFSKKGVTAGQAQTISLFPNTTIMTSAIKKAATSDDTIQMIVFNSGIPKFFDNNCADKIINFYNKNVEKLSE